MAKGLRAAVECRRVGVAVIGLEVPHAHIHLIPMNAVADMNFANPKLKVGEERMKELAAAIAVRVPGTAGSPLNKAAEPANESEDAALAQLRKLTEGLYFVSESEAPLQAVSYAAPAGPLTDAALLELLEESADTPVQTLELTTFLRHHTADDGVLGDAALADRFKALQVFLKQEVDGTQVYRLGEGPRVRAYALGHSSANKLVGFKTILTET